MGDPVSATTTRKYLPSVEAKTTASFASISQSPAETPVIHALIPLAHLLLNTEQQRLAMIESIFQLHNYQAAKKMMDVTHLRQKALAANLANVETPGYKRVDVAPNFRTELQCAVGDGDTSRLQELEAKLAIDKTAIARNRDGNTVQLETELMKMNQNSVEHALESRLVTGALKYLKHAITGRS